MDSIKEINLPGEKTTNKKWNTKKLLTDITNKGGVTKEETTWVKETLKLFTSPTNTTTDNLITAMSSGDEIFTMLFGDGYTENELKEIRKKLVSPLSEAMINETEINDINILVVEKLLKAIEQKIKKFSRKA